MIHTLELIQLLTDEELDDISTNLHFTDEEREKLFGCHKFQTVHRSLNSHNPETGIKTFFVFRRDDGGYQSYYACIRIEPLVMILGKLTVKLFLAIPSNVQKLQNTFHDIMSRYFTNDNLTTLSAWQCRRIDYTSNLHFSRPEEKALFLKMTSKTSRLVRKQKKRILRLKLDDQSTAEGNKSVKVTFYDKYKQIDEKYKNIPAEQKNSLLLAATGIIRFEVQCFKGRILTLQRTYGFTNRGILNFLNERIAYDVLLKEYTNSIGICDFYSFYWAKKKVEASAFSTHKKRRLVQFLQLIAQARHVSTAKEQFIKGTKIKRTDIIVQGSATTFKNYLNDLVSLGINPMLIPKERKITHLANPINKLMNPF